MLTQSPAAPWFIEHAPGKCVLARWRPDVAQIQAQLSALRASGVDGISLSPWIMPNAAALGAGDQYADVTTMRANLAGVIAMIAQLGFHWVQVAPQFYGANDPRQHGMGCFTENWLFMNWLYETLRAFGVPFIIDAVPEFNDVYKQNEPFAQYVRAMWANVTLTSAPGGVPCWAYSMSFVPRDMDCLGPAFQGNWPAILLPHVYSDDNGGLYKALQSVDMATNTGLWDNWIIAETDTLEAGDEAIVQQLRQFVQETKQRILRVCPWPITPRWKPGDSAITVCPIQAAKIWDKA